MSQGDPIPRDRALAAAEHVLRVLRWQTDRVELAGSLRRGKAEVHDIEIVALPKIIERSADDLWDTPISIDITEGAIAAQLDDDSDGRIRLRRVETKRANGSIEYVTKNGPAYKALEVDGIPLDLFIVRPPASWGVIFAVRTGPGDWNTRLVTDCQAIGRRVREGQVEAWIGSIGRWEPVPTPEERDFFAALGQAWIEPAERHVSRVRIQRELAAGAPA